jgi:hypothetical protein
MSYEAKVILDSVGPNGARLTTMECEYPRFIHSEMLTHRAFSRNSASSRAIPFAKMIERVTTDPVIPIRWGSEAKGMQQGSELGEDVAWWCEQSWLAARDDAVMRAQALHDAGLHKSICNRVVEPWMHIRVIITATSWLNFFRQRCHPDAEPHMQKIAYLIREAYDGSTPVARDWHRPYVDEAEGLSVVELCQVSAARCARVSYLTHDGVKNWRKDLELFAKLVNGSGFGHWSPMEHVGFAQPEGQFRRSGNFRGWMQWRQEHANHDGDHRNGEKMP